MIHLTRVLLFLVLTLQCLKGYGDQAVPTGSPGLDFEAGAVSRSKPYGTALFANAGYGVLIWGAPEDGPLSFGFVRPNTKILTSGAAHRASLQVDFFPLSVFGLAAGYAVSSRQADLEGIDCQVNNCRGAWKAPFVQANLVFGYAGWYLLASRQLQFMQSEETTRPLAEEYSYLIAQSDRDRLCDTNIIFGYQFLPEWSAGLQHHVHRMLESQNSNEQITLYGRWERGPYAFTLGAGSFAAPTITKSFTANLIFEWKLKPRLGFF